ncbi:hypothetical protein DFQ12_1940 [Sphingobacterium detergens]|uniref:Uncharacterized protein n=1 Tax=Sphingobacterium detergens TaxID=1145106 RepID=A0A420BJV9_SPHD1|nr:hypothetical protein DFQ12_1940 [Sphingobacterium detergens]
MIGIYSSYAGTKQPQLTKHQYITNKKPLLE